MKVIAMLFFVTCCGVANAQFSAGATVGFPIGTFSDIAKTGLGITAAYEKPINDEVSWTVSSGYQSFHGASYMGGSYGTAYVIPLLAGVRYYKGEGNRLFGAVSVGADFMKYGIYLPYSGSKFESATATKFGVDMGIGVRLAEWEMSGHYYLIEHFNYMGIGFAYLFK